MSTRSQKFPAACCMHGRSAGRIAGILAGALLFLAANALPGAASESMYKLQGPSGIDGDLFGDALAADGEFLVVGARGAPSPFTDPEDLSILPENYPWSGEVYVYRFVADPGDAACLAPESPPCWVLHQTIVNPDPRTLDCCGYPSTGCNVPPRNVPYDPSTGAPVIPNRCQEVEPAYPGFPAGCDPSLPFTGPFGSGCLAGAEPRPEEFTDYGTPGVKLGQPSPGNQDQFGTSVAISGDVLVVGAPGDRGSKDRHLNYYGIGAAWVYRNVDVLQTVPVQQYCSGDPASLAYPQEPPTVSPPCFVLEQELNAGLNSKSRERFGDAVAVFGDRIAVGKPLNVEAIREGQEPTGLWPSTYLYTYNGSRWLLSKVLEGSQNPVIQGVEYFGSALSMSESRLVVGAMGNNEQGFREGEVLASADPAWWDNETIPTSDGLVFGEALCRFGCSAGEILQLENPPLIDGSLEVFSQGLGLVEGVDYGNVDIVAGTFEIFAAQSAADGMDADYQGSEIVEIDYPRITPGTLEVFASGVPLVEGEGFTATSEELSAGQFRLLQPHPDGTVTASYAGGQIVQVQFPPIAMKNTCASRDCCNIPRDLVLYTQADPGSTRVELVCGEDYALKVTDEGLPSGNVQVFGGYAEGTLKADYVQGFGWGAVYLFDSEGNEEAKLFPSTPGVNDLFGASVDVSSDGDQFLVGALLRPYDWDPRTGQLLTPGSSARGAAYVFSRGDSGWSEEAELWVEPLEAESYLGSGVGILNSDSVIVGAPGDDAQVFDGGAVAKFRKGTPAGAEKCTDGSEEPPCWILVDEEAPADISVYDQFGAAIAVNGDWAAYGSPQEEYGPGAVYVERVPEPGVMGFLAALATLAAQAQRSRRPR